MRNEKPPPTLTLLLLLLGGLMGPLSSSAAAQKYMFGRADFATALSPTSVASGDFNGDGKPDLAIADHSSNSVSILLGNPDGTFRAKVDYPVGTAPGSVVAGDFNGDGKLDLAVANLNDNTVSILLGNGDGTFRPVADYATGLSPCSISAGDFNGDGKLDLAVANYFNATVSILLGNGDGTFQGQAEYTTGGYAASVSVGDFDGDTKLDLAVANANCGTVSILLGVGDGTFQPPVDFATGAVPQSVVAGDFNGDRKMDLAVANFNCPSFPCGTGTISILLGNGDGTFQTHVDYAAGSGPSALTAADFNGDGKVDLAVANSNCSSSACGPGLVSILLSNGDGTFRSHMDYPAGTGPASVVTADFSGDGRLDLAVANRSSNTVSILLGTGDGTFPTHVDSSTGSLPQSVATGDFNGDGKLDLATADSATNAVAILLGNGDGTFQPAVEYLTETAPVSVAIGDFNSDGRRDLAVVNTSSNTVSVLLSNGDGTFQPQVDYAAGTQPLFVSTGDFNGDGKLDLVVANQSCPGGPCGLGSVSILLGNGDGTFQAHVDYAAGTAPRWVITDDFNGDAKLDLAIASSGSNVISILLGNGDGTFQTHVDHPTGSTPFAVISGDFNGDGKFDLAVANALSSYSGSVSILLGNGDGTFEPHIDYPTGANPQSVTAGDFDGDGKLDLATVGLTANTVSILRGNGDGTFQSNIGWSVGTAPASMTTGDFNGDGGLDLAVGNRDSSTVSVFLNVPVAALFPSTLNFGFQSPGTTSSSQVGTLSNPSGVPLGMVSILSSGDYGETSTCGPSLAAGADCNINVTFAPAATGTRTGSLAINDTARGSPQTVSLTGVGFTGPNVALSAESLTFADQNVGTTSAAQTVTLVNHGNQALAISGFATSGDFAQISTCGAIVAVNATCAISVMFTPNAPGTRTGTMSISDNAAGSPQTVALAGTGIGPAISLSPTSLTFPGQFVGTGGLPQNVTLTNTGNAALTVASTAATADFSETSGCTTSVAAGVSCTIGVFFDPSAPGTRTGTLRFMDNAPGSPHTVPLIGSGMDLSMSAPSSSAAVSAGQTATYTVMVIPAGGFKQSVALSCKGAPQLATCSLSPASVALDGSRAAESTVTVATTAQSVTSTATWVIPPRTSGWASSLGGTVPLAFLLLLTSATLASLAAPGWQIRFGRLTLAATLFGVTLWIACGGSGGGGGKIDNPGTPPGTYTLTITGTTSSPMGDLTHSITVTLTVN